MTTLIAKIRVFGRINFSLLTFGQGCRLFRLLAPSHSPLATAAKKLENRVTAAKSATSIFLIDKFCPRFALRTFSSLLLATTALSALAAGSSTPAFAAAQANSDASPSTVAAVRHYRQTHEVEIIREFVKLLSIPNTASDAANIARNADLIQQMLDARGFRVQLLPTAQGRGPVIFG